MTPPLESHRSLQAILFTDIVGSTQRATELGDQRWQALLRRHNELIRKRLESHAGREVATAGDGFLAIFDKPSLALRCAASIRDAVGELGISIRAGLHLGAVVATEDEVGGIGVHIGARVAELAGPDEILVSSTLHDAEAGSDYDFEDRGRHELKGVDGEWQLFALVGVPEDEEPAHRPAASQPTVPKTTEPARRSRLVPLAAAVAIIAAILGWWATRGPDAVPGAPIRSLAVLPLANLSPDPEQAYFVDGLHDILIGELSRLDSLTVISRTSVLRYRDPTQSMGQIAGELGVDAVVEGSVFRAGDSIRVQVQLIRGTPEEHLWSQGYDGTVREAMALQTRVARAIADEIEIVLTPQVEARLDTEREVDPAAQEAYYRGIALLRARSHDGLQRAVPLLEEAVRVDPSFALGWVGVADAYGLGQAYGVLDIAKEEALELATAAANRALEINPNLAEAHASLGYLSFYFDWDFRKSEEHLQKAIELNPSYAQAHNWLGDVHTANEAMDEALAAYRTARDLDPFSPIMNRDVGHGYLGVDRCDQALAFVDAAMELDAEILLAAYVQFTCYANSGQYEEAVEAFVHEWAIRDTPEEALQDIVDTFEAEGWEAMLERAGRMLVDLGHPYFAATLFSLLGDFDRAFELLDQFVDERKAEVVHILRDTSLDRLQSDPRWDELLEKGGLQE